MPYPGEPKDTPIPARLDRWNWGAFFLNWIWGVGNSTYIALLMFVPFLNIIMIFVLGAKGSKWAWKNRVWEDEAHFVKTQRNWARAGLVVFIGVILFVPMMFLTITGAMKNSEAYKDSMREIRQDVRVIAELGKPIEPGLMLTGSINLNDADGSAELSIPVTGSKCSGTVISKATKEGGVWDIYLLVVTSDCGAAPIVLINRDNLFINRANSVQDI